MIIKSRYFKDFTEAEIRIGYNSMLKELEVLPEVHPIRELFTETWIDFVLGRFSYDGATFVKERNPLTLFEVSAFIHDWRNFKGYVGKEIDNEFICIMITLNYKPRLIIERWLFMRFTFLNVLRHNFLGNLNNKSPDNLFKI